MKTLKDLLLALVNATLILLALCLFLLWQVSRTGERVAASFAENLEILAPVERGIDGLTSEITGMRADIAELRKIPGQSTEALVARADRIEAELVAIRQSMQTLADTPDRLAQSATQRATEVLGDALTRIPICVPINTGAASNL